MIIYRRRRRNARSPHIIINAVWYRYTTPLTICFYILYDKLCDGTDGAYLLPRTLLKGTTATIVRAYYNTYMCVCV